MGSFRTIKFAKYLVRMGWAVRVVSVRNPDVWRMLGPAEEPPGVEVTRTWDPIRLDRYGAAVRKVILSGGRPGVQAAAGLGRRGVVVPEFQFGWLLTAGEVAARLARRWRATHLMGTGPPFSSLIAAAIAQRRTHLPLLEDFQDSWTIHPDTRYPTSVHSALDRMFERLAWDRATDVTVVTRTIAGRYAALYPQWASKIRVLYNGFDPEDLPAILPSKEGPFRIAYTGSFYPHTPPSTFLTALQVLRAKGTVSADRLQVEFLGRPEPAVQGEIDRRGLQDMVHIRGFRPLREAVGVASCADLLYFLSPPHYGEALSDKMYMYIATGNDIVAELPPGECEDFVREWANHAYILRPGDVPAMVAALSDAIGRGHVAPTTSPKSEKYRNTFSREAEARELARILESMA